MTGKNPCFPTVRDRGENSKGFIPPTSVPGQKRKFQREHVQMVIADRHKNSQPTAPIRSMNFWLLFHLGLPAMPYLTSCS